MLQVESDKTAILANEQHNSGVLEAQAATNIRIAKNHEATIAQLSKDLATARARIDVAGGQKMACRAVADAAITITSADYMVTHSTLTAARAVSLPAPTAATANQQFIYKNETSNTSVVTITPVSGTIDGVASKTTSTAYGIIRVYHNGTNYFTW